MSEIRVAVATQGPPGLARACLEALAREGAGARALLVLSAISRTERAAVIEGAQALPGATVLEEPRSGASRARNRALAECSDDEVVAFVDDDSIVCPNWWSSLRSAWAHADPRVGCIGGSIEVELVGTPPTWISPILLSAYSRLDFGDQPLDLDVTVRAVAGPNMSFRAGALRAAGGFDPSFGHASGRMWFGEEHEAQLALARLGYAIHYDPRPRVRHMVAAESVSRRALLHRRLVYGATLRERGARSRVLASRQSVLSAAGVLTAAMRSDRQLAMVRAFRAAENAGVLLAPVLRPQASTRPRRIA